MTTNFTITHFAPNTTSFLATLVDGVLRTSRKGLPKAYLMALLDACNQLAATPDAQPYTSEIGWTVTKIDTEAKLAALYLELEESNTRATEYFRLFQMNTTATTLLAACGDESLTMDCIRKQISFLADPTLKA